MMPFKKCRKNKNTGKPKKVPGKDITVAEMEMEPYTPKYTQVIGGRTQALLDKRRTGPGAYNISFSHDEFIDMEGGDTWKGGVIELVENAECLPDDAEFQLALVRKKVLSTLVNKYRVRNLGFCGDGKDYAAGLQIFIQSGNGNLYRLKDYAKAFLGHLDALENGLPKYMENYRSEWEMLGNPPGSITLRAGIPSAPVYISSKQARSSKICP